MPRKKDRAQPIFVCWSELFCFYSIGNLPDYVQTAPGGFAAAECIAPLSALLTWRNDLTLLLSCMLLTSFELRKPRRRNIDSGGTPPGVVLAIMEIKCYNLR